MFTKKKESISENEKSTSNGMVMNFVKNACKILFAGVCAGIIISVLLCFYSLTPIHIENEKGNTDYIWEPNSYWVTMSEGIAWGKYDANGFNNVEVIDNPDIIIVGSSHMEAKNVKQNESTGFRLNEMLDGKYTVYNMGISGHHINKTCQYLSASLERFETAPRIVIVEANTVEMSREGVEEILNCSVEFTPSHSRGLLAFLQKIPFLRVMNHQIEDGLLDMFMQKEEYVAEDNDEGDDNAVEVSEKPQEFVEKEPYEILFGYLSSLEKKYNTQIVIFYHPVGELEKDGTISFENSEHLSYFSSEAINNEIDFIDMTADFETMYYEKHKVPHGFVTGKAAFGHLNAYGHEAIAEALYNKIIQMEDSSICK